METRPSAPAWMHDVGRELSRHVALENDSRFAELARLREAAEADRRALLLRLGRKEIVESIVGADGGLAPVLARVDQVAATDVTVQIVGETGSGKEVVARALHERSARHAGPFLRVNCGAIPAELVDSELFGHECGAFTGAARTGVNPATLRSRMRKMGVPWGTFRTVR